MPQTFLAKFVVIITGLFSACLLMVAGTLSRPAYAASSYVQGSYANAMTFANDFCNDPGPGGVGPTYNGLGDMVWITAPDGGNNITAMQGDQFADVVVHIAGRYCSQYNGSNAGSNYYSSMGSISGTMFYNNNGAGNIFNVSASPQKMYIGNLTSGTYRVNMNLSTFYTGAQFFPDSPNAWTDLNITFLQQWSIGGSSSVSVNGGTKKVTTTAKTGDTLQWYHTLHNFGPNATDRNVTWKMQKTGFSNNADTGTTGVRIGANAIYDAYNSGYTKYTVQPSDVGKTFCQFISYWDYRSDWPQNHAPTDPNYRQSPYACVTIPYNFTLTPAVASLGRTEIQPGQALSPVQPSVTNSGPTVSYPNTPWEFVQFTVPPGGTKPGAGTGIVRACSYYGNGCQSKSSGTQASPFSPGTTNLPPFNPDTVGDIASGSQICFALAVKGYGAGVPPSGPNWKYSVPQCVIVAKKPYVQIWGGDLRVGGMIITSSTIKNGAVYGSWAEYGVMSVLSNTNFASGSGLSGGSTASEKERNGLTFANIDNTHNDSYGNYTSGLPASTSASYFIGLSNKQALPTSNLSSVAGFPTGKPPLVYTAGDVTLTQSGALPAGKSVVIVSSGTVTINKDLTYTNAALTSVKDIPQLIIIAKHINITDAVKQVDAWLLTTSADNSDSMSTCSNIVGNLSTTLCSNPLVINGPVATRRLDLRRTAGAGTGAQSGDPAEIINLRPDVYMWGRLEATGVGKAQTVSTTELPPRF